MKIKRFNESVDEDGTQYDEDEGIYKALVAQLRRTIDNYSRHLDIEDIKKALNEVSKEYTE